MDERSMSNSEMVRALRAQGWTVLVPMPAEKILALNEVLRDPPLSFVDLMMVRESVPGGLDPNYEPGGRKGRSRSGDHATSRQGARDVQRRAGTQGHRLLTAYANTVKDGLTDEEAACLARTLGSCYWKRAGELREDGLIETVPGLNPDGVLTRVGSAGTARIVCRITDKGREVLAKAAPRIAL